MSGRQTRFKAMWIRRQYMNSNGEWNSDTEEYGFSYQPTREAAEAAVASASKNARIEWFAIAEQNHIEHKWVDQRRWSGDGDGIVGRTFTADEGE